MMRQASKLATATVLPSQLHTSSMGTIQALGRSRPRVLRESWGVPRSVLIVEDELFVAMDLTHVFEDHGWIVLGPAPSVHRALQILEEKLPTVAILDVNLRDELVTPVAAVLRDRSIPFVVASAVSDPHQLCGEFGNGVPILHKPVDEFQLLYIVDQLASHMPARSGGVSQ